MSTVTRKIQFFKTELLVYNAWREVLEPIQDQVQISNQVMTSINSLPFDDSQHSRYLEVDSNNDLFMFIDDMQNYISGRLVLSRKNLLPEVEEQGQLTPLSIPVEAGLAEVTHFILFPEYNILGLEFNFFGPRPSRYAEYLQSKTDINAVNLHPILRMDVEEQLDRMGEVSLLQIEAHRNAVGILNELNESLGSAFRSAADLSDAETVEIILRKKRYSRTGFDFPFSRRRLTEILKRNDFREMFNKFRGVARNTVVEHGNRFDFLEDKMIVSKKITRLNPRSRSVDTVSMHLAIRQAFDEMRDQLAIERPD